MYFEGLLTDIIDSDRKMLMSMMTSEKLSHAYLFVSDSAINAENVCAEFLGMIMSDENSFENILTRIRNHNHTDVMHIYPDGSTVKIKQLRNVVPEFLQSSPTEASNRAVIIHEAEKMTDESQNFLLKTIEEPPKGAIMILLSDSVENILPTIMSRVTKITLKSTSHSVDDPQIRKFIAERMEKLILEGSIEGIFSTAVALTNSADENDKNKSQKDAALINLEYVYAFFTQLLLFKTTGRTREYTKEDFGILTGKIGHLCNLNIIDIIEDTITRVAHNASVRLALESMLIRILEECNAENSWNKI